LTLPHKKIYFLSDFHLGAPNYADSLIREKKIVAFLESIKNDASEIFILGDMFDFWYEYKTTVPKGYTRIFGKLAEITDAGTPIHFFVGNHDMWMNGYFEKELGIKVYFEPIIIERFGKKLFIAHGDGLGPGDKGYKFLKKIFRNPICNWLFGFAHPTVGMGVANYFSQSSRKKTGFADEKFLGEDNEWLILFSKKKIENENLDYLIFGHRHYPLKLQLNHKNAYYINTGDWITNFTYGVLDENIMVIEQYES
jgi:UDP-2,3-diacylglucosamine hydrolase